MLRRRRADGLLIGCRTAHLNWKSEIGVVAHSLEIESM
jgi:hypothetical protein